MRKSWTMLAATLALAGCANDENPGNPLDAAAPGIYFGQTGGDTSISLLIAPNGLTYIFDFAHDAVLRAYLGGPATAITGDARVYTKTDDPNVLYQLSTFTLPGSVTAAVDTETGSLTGSFTSDGETMTFEADPSPLTAVPAGAAAVAGNWSVEANSQFIRVAISAGGAITGVDEADCTYSGGIVAARADINLYNLNLNIACTGEATISYTGMAAIQPGEEGDPDQLVAIMGDNTSTIVIGLEKQAL